MKKGIKIVALLPMKGHSERISGKNFRDFNGKPLFGWILDTLLSIDRVDTVVINTDVREVLASHGINDNGRILIRDRGPELCGDFTSMNRVIEDDVLAVPADLYLMTHATNPLLRAATITAAMDKFQDLAERDEADSLFTVNRFQTRFYRADGSPVNHDPSNLLRTQDLEPWYEENSNLYIFTKESFQAADARIGLRPAMFEMEKWESVDIDDGQSWELAKAIALSRISG